ncbi:hypothetical protein BAME_29850 [Bacillus sp. M 2-6]|nr:hypothetical protein BAME_29850 [Bacillus sp. M 2-6]
MCFLLFHSIVFYSSPSPFSLFNKTADYGRLKQKGEPEDE